MPQQDLHLARAKRIDATRGTEPKLVTYGVQDRSRERNQIGQTLGMRAALTHHRAGRV
jgi:hypothetical protein